MDKKSGVCWDKMAKRSVLLPQYLIYQRLSDGALHTSAASLDVHIARGPDEQKCTYKVGPGDPGDISATLHQAVLAAIPVGIVVSKIVPDSKSNAALASLADRLKVLPTGNVV